MCKRLDNPNCEDKITERMQLPSKNEFIPENFDLINKIEIPNEYPIDIIPPEFQEMGKIYFKLDSYFNLPYLNVTYLLYYRSFKL